MAYFSKDVRRKCDIEIINDPNDGKYFWLNEKHLEYEIGYSCLTVFTNKYHKKNKKCRHELNENSKKQRQRRFIRNDLGDCSVKTMRTDKIKELRKKLGCNVIDVFNTNEKSLKGAIKDAFEGENMQTQYYVLGYKYDLYFPDYKIAVEDDEFNHVDKDPEYEAKRRIEIEEELHCTFIRFNTNDAPNFKLNKAINEIYRQIKQSVKKETEESTKKSQIDNLSRELLKFKFKQHNAIKSKCLKWIVKKIITKYKE